MTSASPDVVLAGEERVLAEAVELLLDRAHVLVQLAGEVAVELEQLLGVLVVADEPLVAVESLRQSRVLGGDVRGAPLVVPEAGLAHRLRELGRAGLK